MWFSGRSGASENIGDSFEFAMSAGRWDNRITVQVQPQLTIILCFVFAIVAGYFVGRTLGVRDRIGSDRE
jgi:hypothetical protein